MVAIKGVAPSAMSGTPRQDAQQAQHDKRPLAWQAKAPVCVPCVPTGKAQAGSSAPASEQVCAAHVQSPDVVVLQGDDNAPCLSGFCFSQGQLQLWWQGCILLQVVL